MKLRLETDLIGNPHQEVRFLQQHSLIQVVRIVDVDGGNLSCEIPAVAKQTPLEDVKAQLVVQVQRHRSHRSAIRLVGLHVQGIGKLIQNDS